jgi:hypothetical protein
MDGRTDIFITWGFIYFCLLREEILKTKISATSKCAVFCDADLATGRSKLATLMMVAIIKMKIR